MKHILLAASLCVAQVLAADWATQSVDNPDSPGKAVLITKDGKPVARFVHGDGQKKPFLHVYGAQGELLTNGGLDKSGKDAGKFPHHRGIYIGWKITGAGGTYDLWHLHKGEVMTVKSIAPAKVDAQGVTLVATIEWRTGKAAKEDVLLLTEVRTQRITRDAAGRTQVDFQTRLEAAVDLALGGDLQHAGCHFRAHNEVADQHAGKTVYLWEPAGKAEGSGKVVSSEFKWSQLRFPIGKNWYTATQYNASANPVEELSWRDYGRFGFFFKRDLKKSESQSLAYRFVIEPSQAPAGGLNKLSDDQAAAARAHANRAHQQFTTETARP